MINDQVPPQLIHILRELEKDLFMIFSIFFLTFAFYLPILKKAG